MKIPYGVEPVGGVGQDPQIQILILAGIGRQGFNDGAALSGVCDADDEGAHGEFEFVEEIAKEKLGLLYENEILFRSDINK